MREANQNTWGGARSVKGAMEPTKGAVGDRSPEQPAGVPTIRSGRRVPGEAMSRHGVPRTESFCLAWRAEKRAVRTNRRTFASPQLRGCPSLSLSPSDPPLAGPSSPPPSFLFTCHDATNESREQKFYGGGTSKLGAPARTQTHTLALRGARNSAPRAQSNQSVLCRGAGGGQGEIEIDILGAAVAQRLDCSLSYHDEPGSIPVQATPEFSGVGIVLDDSAGRRVFSGISRFPNSFNPVLLHTSFTLFGSQDLAVKSRPNLFTHYPLVHFVFNASRRTLAQSSPSSVTTYNQCAADIDVYAHTTVLSSLQPMRAKRGENGAALECEGGGKWEIPEKTRRAASSGTTPSYESPGAASPGIEPGSPWQEPSAPPATPLRPQDLFEINEFHKTSDKSAIYQLKSVSFPTKRLTDCSASEYGSQTQSLLALTPAAHPRKMASARRKKDGRTPFTNQRPDKIDVKHLYTEVDFVIGSHFSRHALDDSEPIADLQGNNAKKPRIDYILKHAVANESQDPSQSLTQPIGEWVPKGGTFT
ncbi:hypothetical protein PR048_022274 [Dryococelus australis]|uniref:Uncharacterized protein n=1 Tax=Dryococelus australis TaxID=614101 RepID=A0ABQ9H0J0_9NEOP|nr:hypothetical protein PR048_022274 [Dryococelus australis]